jgi:hypothetical protein
VRDIRSSQNIGEEYGQGGPHASGVVQAFWFQE